MKNTIAICSHNRDIQRQTTLALHELVRAGVLYIDQSGSADVALARNLALTAACNALRAQPARDIVLMVDDDMVFTVEDCEKLADHARETNVPASAMYATLAGTLAASRLRTPSGDDQRWAVGLGLVAIPRELLLALEANSERFLFMGEPQFGFTWSAAAGGIFWSEDYTLSRRLGGVHLLPLGVGHLKTIPVYPDEATIACVREGRRLPGDLDANVLAHIEDPSMAERSAVDRALLGPQPLRDDPKPKRCDHKFIDSNICLKCGWGPDAARV